MSKRFIQLTTGWIPASVMLLFATALVLGQDRSELATEQEPGTAPTTAEVLPVPEIIEISTGATTRTGPDTVRRVTTPDE